MKNLLLIAAMALTLVAVGNETAFAGGGGGKSNSKARFNITNTNPVGQQGIAVWVRPTGTAVPATLGALRSKLTFIGPGKSFNTSRMKKGSYDIAIVGANDISGLADNTPIGINDAIDNRTFQLNGVDQRIGVNDAGIFN
jgi:hypothetical protein